jgi:hypothetical protein
VKNAGQHCCWNLRGEVSRGRGANVHVELSQYRQQGKDMSEREEEILEHAGIILDAVALS